jgi:hypothetical protein
MVGAGKGAQRRGLSQQVAPGRPFVRALQAHTTGLARPPQAAPPRPARPPPPPPPARPRAAAPYL